MHEHLNCEGLSVISNNIYFPHYKKRMEGINFVLHVFLNLRVVLYILQKEREYLITTYCGFPTRRKIPYVLFIFDYF